MLVSLWFVTPYAGILISPEQKQTFQIVHAVLLIPRIHFSIPPHQVMCSEQHIRSTWMFAEQIKQMDSGCRLCTITVNGDPPPFKHRRRHAAPAVWLQMARRGVKCDSSDAAVHTRVKRSETRRDPSLSTRGVCLHTVSAEVMWMILEVHAEASPSGCYVKVTAC